jgi:hypothetical protein
MESVGDEMRFVDAFLQGGWLFVAGIFWSLYLCPRVVNFICTKLYGDARDGKQTEAPPAPK